MLKIVIRGFFILLTCVALLWFSVKNSERSSVRSVTIPLDNSGVELIFSVIWDPDLRQKLQITNSISNSKSSGFEDVFKRTYNSGGPIFRSPDRRKVFVFFWSGAYEIDLEKFSIEKNCFLKDALGLEFMGRFEYKAKQSEESKDQVEFVPRGKISSATTDNVAGCG
jgi:hypothetical protein